MNDSFIVFTKFLFRFSVRTQQKQNKKITEAEMYPRSYVTIVVHIIMPPLKTYQEQTCDTILLVHRSLSIDTFGIFPDVQTNVLLFRGQHDCICFKTCVPCTCPHMLWSINIDGIVMQ